jgi:ribonuclease HII
MLVFERRLKRRGYRLICGIDESGRGPLAGPVVASAVVLKKYRFKARIYDAKILTPRQRFRAYREIMANAAVGVGVVDEKTVDEINILEATKLAMQAALARLRPQPHYILVDGNMKPNFRVPAKSIVKGDRRSLSIAAASIVSKVTRDRIMDRYHKRYPQYFFCTNRGYATRQHLEALNRFGPSPIHRWSFHPLRNVRQRD